MAKKKAHEKKKIHHHFVKIFHWYDRNKKELLKLGIVVAVLGFGVRLLRAIFGFTPVWENAFFIVAFILFAASLAFWLSERI